MLTEPPDSPPNESVVDTTVDTSTHPPTTSGTPSHNNAYEQGVIDALTQVAWVRGDRTVLNMRTEPTRFDNWWGLIEAAIQQYDQERRMRVDAQSSRAPTAGVINDGQ